MRDTLPALVERALTGNCRPLEFYLREQSRLPGPRANLELVEDLSALLAASVEERPGQVRAVLTYLLADNREQITTNTPAEFVILCGMVASGACAAEHPQWQAETFALLDSHATSVCWRVREGVVLAFQRLVKAAPAQALAYLSGLAASEDFLRQRVAVATLAEPVLLRDREVLAASLAMQRQALEHLREAGAEERKREGFRVLRQTLGYSLSVVAAATPDDGFALMRECATWNDDDVRWLLRENIKKKRLAKFPDQLESLSRLLAR